MEGAGGGSGGSIWIYTNVVKGYGRLTANGGDGYTHATNPGSGGGGGRIALYFMWVAKILIRYNSMIM